MRLRAVFQLLLLSLLLALAFGCRNAYYGMWETLGREKRHLLRDQIEKMMSDQDKAAVEFKTAVTRIKEIYGFDGGNIEAFYHKINSDYETCLARSRIIDDRIDKVNRIAEDLFTEWEKEIGDISNTNLKNKSLQSLNDTRIRFGYLKTAMTAAQQRMTPVLTTLKDYVLFVKHNLNAKAIGPLQQEVGEIESDVENLIREMTASISAAETFLNDFM